MNCKDQQNSDFRSAVLLNTFLVEKKRYRVFYNNGLLVWEKEKSKKNKCCIPIEDLISVSLPKQRKITSQSQGFPVIDSASPSLNSDVIPNEEFTYKSFTINYAKRLIDVEQGTADKDVNKWRTHSLTLHNNDKMIVKEWFDTLSKVLSALNRPRKLLLFINPYGGKQNALKIYEKYAKPIFQLANVDVSVVITQRSNQIFDLVLQQHLEHFDGIACCGGDGTFSELFNGLIYRDIIKEHSNDSSKIDVENIPKPKKPLGIIPAGSTDTIAYCLHGTTDIKTCIIHIVLGQTTGLDLSSVSSDKGIIKFYASVMSYGYLGDLLFESEKLRWLGPKRYDYAGFKKIIRNRPYEVEILLLEDGTENNQEEKTNCDSKDKIKCLENCPVCSANISDVKPATEEKFKRVTGSFFMVNGANISCACKRSPSGFSPFSHLGDGYVDVILIRHGSLWNNLKLLLTLSSATGDIESLPYVEFYRTRKFHIKALNSSSDRSLTDSTDPMTFALNKSCSVWNCDGEILQETDVTVRSHRQLITVYRRGAVSETSDSTRSCCL